MFSVLLWVVSMVVWLGIRRCVLFLIVGSVRVVIVLSIMFFILRKYVSNIEGDKKIKKNRRKFWKGKWLG